MKVADRNFEVGRDSWNLRYYCEATGYTVVPRECTRRMCVMLLEDTPIGRYRTWDQSNYRERWTLGVDPDGQMVGDDEGSGGEASSTVKWGASMMGDLWNRMQGGRVSLKKAIKEAAATTNLSASEAKQVLSARSRADARSRHMSLEKEVELDAYPIRDPPVDCSFDYCGVGGDWDAFNEAAGRLGMCTRLVFASEINNRLRQTFTNSCAREGVDAPLIGALAGFANGSTNATAVTIGWASCPCPGNNTDPNGRSLGHTTGDTREGMVAMMSMLANGKPPFLCLENVPGSEHQEPTACLIDLAHECGGSSITVERSCKSLGVLVSGSRVFTILLNSISVEYMEELRIALQRVERRELPLMHRWWGDRKLSEEFRNGSGLQVELWPANRHTSGREDAPTKVGEVKDKAGRHHCYIYDGETNEAIFKRPTRNASTPKGMGVYLYQGRLYVPTIEGAALYMGINMKLLRGLSKQEQATALGNMVPTELVVSVATPMLELLRKYPSIVDRSRELDEVRADLRDMVEAHQMRVVQPGYVAHYPRGQHRVVEIYRGSAHPRLEVTAVGGSISTARGMQELGLFRTVAVVTQDAASARAILGASAKVVRPEAGEEIRKLKSAVIVGSLHELSSQERETYGHIMKADWLVLQVRFFGEPGSERGPVRQWMGELLEARNGPVAGASARECVMDLTDIHTGGYADVIAAQVTIATYTVGVIAARRGASKVDYGLDDCGSIISHLVSPSSVIDNAGRRLQVREAPVAPRRGQKPIVLGTTPEGRDIVDPSGPMAYPCTALIADKRLERKDSGKACVRDLFVEEVMSLWGAPDEEHVKAVVSRCDGAAEVLALMRDETPLLTNQVLGLRLYQHLVPQLQSSARKRVYGKACTTEGAEIEPRPRPGESCGIERPSIPGLDLKVLERDEHFAVGDEMLCVKAGTTVTVVTRRPKRAESTEGLFPGYSF
jgi:hypothetical protein